MSGHFEVLGRWGRRADDPDSIAARLADYLDNLASIDSAFTRWHRDGLRHRSRVPREITLPADRRELRTWIEECAQSEARDGRKHLRGWSTSARKANGHAPYVSLWLSANRCDPPGSFQNRVGLVIGAAPDDPAGPARHARLLLLSVVACWRPQWAGIAPGNYSGVDLLHKGGAVPLYDSGWMVYLAPDLAQRVCPDGVAHERLPDGGLILRATTDPLFNGHSPPHRAGAQRLQAVLMQLGSRNMPKPVRLS